eukprot:TRINITY_DN3547_c0_g2_i1.p1 TRINITY_DN3547_c0_g2~~TRINITY_DN3547_c0_g2_i1.p1  ORF type:complete len:371 (+),score=33.35 TRINITY_DN3547_c0_g2_i1:154-1113(+)
MRSYTLTNTVSCQNCLQLQQQPAKGSSTKVQLSKNIGGQMKFWAVSDLHTDYVDNYKWCQSLSTEKYQDDCLIVAGDVTDDLDKLRRTLVCLKERFKEVFFTPGNHELWLRMPQRAEMDSIEKLSLIQNLCEKIDVKTRPTLVEGVWIIPILSWYHASWDKLDDIPGATPIEKVMIDFQLCQWPDGLHDCTLAKYFDELNDFFDYSFLNQSESDRPFVISFSHFLPFQSLLPGKQYLRFSNLHKAAGSEFLGERVKQLRPDVHVFGHTHILCDKVIDNTRFIQWPVGYPRERNRLNIDVLDWTPLLLYDTCSSMNGNGL